MNKVELRKALLQERQAIAQQDWQEKSLQLCHQIQQSSWFQSAQTVLAYFSFRQEPDLSALFSVSKTWGMSRCVGKELHWHRWSPSASLPLQTGRFGILEPHPEAPRSNPKPWT
jgi:5-formyltetrahydrofolate cyclo-ligase